MKKTLSILVFTLLLAVGWTNVASAQKISQGKPWYTSTFFTKMQQPTMTNDKAAQPVELSDKRDAVVVASLNGESPRQAPRRANYTVTAAATHVKSWYDAKHYTWYDENDNEQTASYTDTVEDAHQMFWFTRSLYCDPTMPGIKFTAAQNYDSNTVGYDLAYNGCDFGYWISGDIQQDISISMTSYCYITAIYVTDYAGNIITSYDVDDGATPPSGWSMPNGDYMTRTSEYVSGQGTWYYWKFTSNNYTDFYTAFKISKDLLVGKGGVYVQVIARQGYSSSATRNYTYFVNRYDYNRNVSYVGEYHNMANSWAIYESMVNAPVTPPNENGYSVVLVKLTNDFDYSTGQAEMYTYTDSALYAYFDKYVDEMVLLTDGMRVEEGEVDAGTVFTYSGLLNRFYFISKGKTYPIGGWENKWATNSNTGNYERSADRAPFYNMYEEFSPTTTSNTTGIDDFYSKMLEGESYDIIHDCQSVNYMEHFFSMTGTNGTEQKSLTNLIFYIPDNRSTTSSRNYNEEHLPQVGLYNITLTAKAKPVANYSSSNRYYDVTNDWVSSLSRILDFDLDQDYELWIWIYDAQGNPVAKEKVPGTDLFHNTLTYTYTVPQYPESYTIVYRVKGWPTDATNNPINDPDGTFYTWSNLAEVTIPGYSEFLSVGLDHYESDFKIDEEHNYYRNFLTVANQNPENQLTPNRVLAGENLFKLYRYEDGEENTKVKAADLRFYQSGNDIRYKIDYYGQNILSGYELPMTTPVRIDTAGVVATLGGGGGGTTTPTDVNFIVGTNTGNNTSANAADQMTNGTVTISSTAAAFARTDHYRLASGSTTTISTNSGTITKIVFNGTSTGYITPLQLASGASGSLSVSGSVATWTGDASSINFTTTAQVRCTSIVVTVETTSKGADRAFTLLDNQLNVANYTTGYVYPENPWSVEGTQIRLQSNGYFYILDGTGLNFTMPSGYNGANLKFVVHVGSSDYYRGSFIFNAPSGTYNLATTAQNTDYEYTIPNVSSGDVINIKGTCYVGATGTTLYNYTPDFTTLYVYVEGGQSGIGGDDPLYLADIMFVDQFKAETKNDAHPHLYSYFLQFDDPTTGEAAKSSPKDVPVQHTGATLGGYYTTAEIQGDTERQLTMNVMNADVNMTLANNPAIYYYTLDRKPSTTPNADWLELSELQIRTNGTYQEIDELLTQYKEQICDPGAVERYDNYDVQTGSYNAYMSYVPIVWTHGELQSNRRIKWDTEKLHNSYGAPIWKTGVGDAKILSADSWRQQGKYGSTNWADENGDSCSLYFLEVTAQGFLPTNNTVGNENGYVPYVPYWFNVYAVSQSGQLRGYSQVGTPGTDPENTGDAGSHLVNNPEKNRYIWHVYGGRTTDGYLEKHLSSTWADNFAFGALNNISDLQIIVRFYYVVNGMIQSTDYVMDRDGAPAGYGAESPGFSPEPHTGIIEVLNPNHGNVVKTTYVNPQGLQSDKPFDGVNIVINRYEDGTTSTSKVIR